ncbi:hypothetical protein MUK42_18750 [Musa troglodytarum]|uniref:Uncharacterized protein n=1 Tax=Musa troglodytarum TaxID=320322 RepID=A0A9E7F9I2_9LILI|nr:hypothetical protein MUK42_18750 [Musa troglodytarum]
MGTSGTRLRFFAPGRSMGGFSCRPPALVSQSAVAVVRKGGGPVRHISTVAVDDDVNPFTPSSSVAIVEWHWRRPPTVRGNEVYQQ